jgi:hypothetical protein
VARKRQKNKRSLTEYTTKELSSISRPASTIEEKEIILIYCEGKNTEPSYFLQFELVTAEIKSLGEGKNTKTLVQKAITLSKKRDYDQVWCVFDMDEHGMQNFNDAVRIAEQNNIGVAYSNQAFEYWLILHFEDHQGGKMNRKIYNKKINKYINPLKASYNGSKTKIIDDNFFDLLRGTDERTQESREELAIKRAKKIYSRYNHLSPGKEESSTTVFRLVEEIKKYL